jgi:hypothetical protein
VSFLVARWQRFFNRPRTLSNWVKGSLFVKTVLLTVFFLIFSVPHLSNATNSSKAKVDASAKSVNILLQPWKGPYGGVPPFDKIKVSDFKPALEKAMDEERREVEAIANNPAPPTFENTWLAL